MAKKAPKTVWFVYLARCADGTLYCGVTTDLKRRFSEHNGSPKGARYTRSRRPVVLAWHQKKLTRSAALKREYAVKQLSRGEKEKLVDSRCLPIKRTLKSVPTKKSLEK
ncbi:MAG: GIY-YIG nuclease family protein [Planctomycetota bacterium]